MQGEAQIEFCGVLHVHLQPLQLVQLFDTALHLHGFGSLVPEALNEGFGLLDHLLLVEIGAYLLFMAFLTESDKLRIGYIIVVDPSECDLDGACSGVVEESAVVAYEQHGGRTAFEKILQPLDRLDVKVVGRLVQHEQIGVLQENLSQLDTHSPASGELRYGTVEIASLKAQADDGTVHLGNERGFA